MILPLYTSWVYLTYYDAILNIADHFDDSPIVHKLGIAHNCDITLRVLDHFDDIGIFH